ncbi:MAG: FtsW/RodA/SpoVE family cell cycle protein [Psychroflexus sp.]|nr:FtsW/RodA/SpoVE family cell cycle protein [Psychroflexus sp.]MDN6309353.1 FtsW/RodA/SpoVE family cell cycle protein [Psychroflexus sp.]
MLNFLKNIQGDRAIWAVVAALALFSIVPVFSASSNLAYLNGGDGDTFSYVLKHLVHLVFGFALIYLFHRIPYHYFKGLSMIMIPVVILLLIVTLTQGTTIGGANASRWIHVPYVNLSFQTSSLASLVLLMYVARYLAKYKDQEIQFKQSIFFLWIPVFVIIGLILPANLSTASLVFAMVMILAFVGQYPLKYLGYILSFGLVLLLVFGLTAKAFPDLFPNRIDTWISRIENFSESSGEEQYQVEKAKIAIATGGVFGQGAGKSVQRNFLPQSSSDFIYAIIVEEFGLIGGVLILLAYLFLFFRFTIVVVKSSTFYAKLLAIAVGLPVIFQALVNMGVAVELIPVTGQTLPLISSGGSSIWMTCAAVGVMLSVSKKSNRSEETNDEITETDPSEENPLDVLSETV